MNTQTIDRPTATARWASPSETTAYRHREGDILLGYTSGLTNLAADTDARLVDIADRLQQSSLISTHPDWASEHLGNIDAWRSRLSTARIPIGYGDNRHLVTVAGSRSGKGTSAIIPNLCIYPGSCVVIDPKGENASITSARRGTGSQYCDGMGQRVSVLDPFKISRIQPDLHAAYNPLDLLIEGDESMIDKAASIAEALVVQSNEKDAHWDESARELIKALILYVCLTETEDRHLLRVLDLLRSGVRGAPEDQISITDEDDNPDYFRSLLYNMSEEARLNGAISGIAEALLDASAGEYGSILSNARRNLSFMEKPGMRQVLARSTFNIDDLKLAKGGMTVYLCLPPTRMADCGRWLRLMTAVMLDRVYTVKFNTDPKTGDAPDDATATGFPILFLLEEFPVLGHMKIIETAAGFAAGYGVKLWLVIQDLTQLKRHYKEGWETFIGNAGIIQAFGNSDVTSLEYLSKKLGETETVQSVTSTTTSAALATNDPSEYQKANAYIGHGKLGAFVAPLLATADQQSTGYTETTTRATNPQIQRSPLIKPDEIERLFRRETNMQMVLIKGERPIALHREEYFSAPQFLGLFNPDRAPRRNKADALREAQSIREIRDQETQQTVTDAAAFASDLTTALDEFDAD
ncbi:type IV secretory system conjugative DNA transfer family protein [Shimia sediminis]|uniref:type IV secretory system conjugative DNA transfer family protein n=1 Tax=Shimia sediminis TaxID=2497945 RepID=UPI0013E01BEB|nr:type IV secretory system conjugative DNA transfer family protein [Shimia sediminis]